MSNDVALQDDIERIWGEKMRAGEWVWIQAYLDRVWPKTVIQELSLAEGLDSTDLRAAVLAGLGSEAPTESARPDGASRTNGSNGSGV